MRIRSVLCALIAVAALASRAMAAPAVIKVFEAKAHEAAAGDSPVLATLPENAQVSVSEDVTDGWRRVRLSDGRVAFIRDADVTLSAPAATPAPYPPTQAAGQAPAPVTPIAPPAPAAASSPAGAHIYVKDLHHLADLVKPDNVIYPKAAALADRHTAAMTVAIGTGAVGALLMLGGLTVMSHQNCTDLGGGTTPFCTTEPNVAAILIGAGVALLGPLIGLAMEPSRNDLLDVVNEWNTRHADQQFTIDRQTGFGH